MAARQSRAFLLRHLERIMPNLESWEGSLVALNLVDRELAEAFHVFHEALEENERARLHVTTVEYPFLSTLVSKGKPQWPSGEPLGDPFIVAHGLPFGVILNNSCEVLDTIVGGQGTTMPQAVLRPGHPIGLFELLDQLSGRIRSPAPDWTILSGAYNFHTVCPVERAEFVRRLRRGESEEDQSLFDVSKYENTERLAERILLVPRIKSVLKNWSVKVLFFSKAWFDALERSLERLPRMQPGGLHAATIALCNLLFRRGWRAVAPIRRSSSAVYSAFVPNRKLDAQTAILTRSAYRLFSRMVDFLAGRRPVFVVDKKDSEYGPYYSLSESFLKAGGARNDLFFLRPATLGPEAPVGYMPLDVILPTTFGEGTVQKSVLEDLLRQIHNAYRRSVEGLEPIRMAPNVFEQLTFRVPRLGDRSKQAGQTANEAFGVQMTREGTPSFRVSDTVFFSPDIGEINAKNHPFFRGCARIEYKPLELS
jgi:hypothetical protein